ncbi:MAG TPA: MFS transporter [Gaiellaceae bacterium]|jgi:MFS family permease|nr:MFS transporter [Gaiellaceae bacterium]
MRSLLARRDVRLLLAGQTLSMFGDWAMIIVLAIWAKVLTGSNAQAGLVFFAFALASLFAPLGGLVVDRVRKRPLMIATHIVMAGIVCLLLLVHDRSDMWLLYTVTVLYGLGGDFFGAAQSAMMKAMIPDEELGEANGVFQSIREGLRLVAPLAGAGIFAAFGGGAVALVDAASFAASAATLVALPFVEPPPAVKEHHFLREISLGVTHIARTRALRELTIGVAAALFVAGFSETLLFAITHAMHRSPAFIGVVSTAQGVGAIAGGVTASRLLKRLGEVRLAGVGLALFGFGDSCWLVAKLGVVLPATAFSGLGIAWAVVALVTAYQRRSPSEVQGRVAAAANMLLSVPQTISIAAGAVLITLVDYRVEIVAMAVVFLLSSVYLLTRRGDDAIEVAPVTA